jgi:hypothetical protein
MKTLLTSTALVAMLATSAMANSLTSTNTVDWAGNSGNGSTPIDTVACTFVQTTDGTMEIGADGKTWTTTAAATVELLVRNGYADGNAGTGANPFDFKYALDKITVQPVKKDGTTLGGSVWEVGGTAEYSAVVDYTDTLAAVVTAKPAGWTNTNVTVVSDGQSPASDKLEITQTGAESGTVEIKLGGTATVDLPANTVLAANTEYKVTHLVTCMQNGTAGPWDNGVNTGTTNN